MIDVSQSLGHAGVVAPTRRRPHRALAGWRASLAFHHDFRQLWVGDTISQLGTQLTLLALPVLAVTVLDAGELEMGLLATFEALAFLVVGLPAGAWVDRWRRKRVLVTGDVVRGLALLTLPAAWLLDAMTMSHLYVVALVVGVATVFFDVAYQSYLPELVPGERIGEGNAKLQASQSLAQVLGPAIGGVGIRLLGAPLVIALDALSFLGSVVFTLRIRHVDTPPRRLDRRPLHVEVGEGLSFVLHSPLLVRIAACTSLSNLFASMTGALLVLFVVRDLGLGAATLGLVFSAGSVGGLVGALSAGWVQRRLGEGRTIPLSLAATAPLAALTPLAAVLPPVPTLVVGSAGMFFGNVLYNVTQVSFRQRLCPRPLLGRMNASVRFVVWGTMPVGAFAGGLLGETVGVVPTLWVAVVGQVLAVLPVLASPLLRMRDLPRCSTGTPRPLDLERAPGCCVVGMTTTTRTIGTRTVPALGTGTWAMGGPWTFDGAAAGWGEVDDDESVATLHAAHEAGSARRRHRRRLRLRSRRARRRPRGGVVPGRRGPGDQGRPRHRRGDPHRRRVGPVPRHRAPRLRGQPAPSRHRPDRRLPDPPRRRDARGRRPTSSRCSRSWCRGQGALLRLERVRPGGGRRRRGGRARASRSRASSTCCSATRRPGSAEAHGLTLLARTPLAMGLLGGRYQRPEDLPGGDVRRQTPYWTFFTEGRMDEWLARLGSVREVLPGGGRTLVQGALAYVWASRPPRCPSPARGRWRRCASRRAPSSTGRSAPRRSRRSTGW